MHDLRITFDLGKKLSGFSRYGLNWFVRMFYFESLPSTPEELGSMLEGYESLSRKILRDSFLLKELDIDDESQADQVTKALDRIKATMENVPEYWAIMMHDYISVVKEFINQNDAQSAAWAMSVLANARFMLTFKQFFEETIWQGVTAAKLENLLQIWNTNKDSANEDFWQKTLSENSYLLAQIFSFPVIILEDPGNMGGKGPDNSGGNLVDFLLTNRLSQNAILAEIKTPKTRLLGAKYRQVYSISKELTGAINQVSNYKDSLLKHYITLVHDYEHDFYAFNPKCLVIAGTLSDEIGSDKTRRKSFELFRNGLKDVEVITYDELFNKIKILMDLLGSDVP